MLHSLFRDLRELKGNKNSSQDFTPTPLICRDLRCRVSPPVALQRNVGRGRARSPTRRIRVTKPRDIGTIFDWNQGENRHSPSRWLVLISHLLSAAQQVLPMEQLPPPGFGLPTVLVCVLEHKAQAPGSHLAHSLENWKEISSPTCLSSIQGFCSDYPTL